MRTSITTAITARGVVILTAVTLLGAMLPMVTAAPPAAAAPAASHGCQWMNEGEYNEPYTTGIGMANTYFSGDAITLSVTRSTETKGYPVWVLEVDNRVVSRQTMTGSSLRFPYQFAADSYSDVYLYTTSGYNPAVMSGTCVPTTQEAFRILTWPHLQGGMEQEPYESVLGASGGTGPYAWTALSGALPPGLRLSSAGVIDGTPTEPGSFDFTVQATDATGAVVAKGVSIEIWPAPSDEEWVGICHQADDGYVFDVAPASVLLGEGEHGDHAGDIIPPTEFGEGRNWDSSGQSIYLDDCTAPVDELVDVDEDGLIGLVDADDDGDGIADAADPDDDGDGVPDSEESAVLDTDGDGVLDVVDSDDDGDGLADVADPDADGDGVPNAQDPGYVAVPDQDGDDLPDALDPDDDGDCILDAVDPDRDGDGISNDVDPDIDNDGTPNSVDVDEDGDGVPNLLDLDVDGNGVANTGESSARTVRAKLQCVTNEDADGDGIPNVKDPDDDNDGIPDSTDVTTKRPWVDTDLDGIANVADSDLDGDGIANASDPDLDGDGVPNTRDVDDDGDGVVDARGMSSSGKAVRPVRASTTVTFASMSDVLSAGAKARLTALVKKAGRSPSTVVSIGYVQESGTSANDKQLSSARARAAASYLASLGVKSVFSVRGDGVGGTGPTARKVVVTVVERP